MSRTQQKYQLQIVDFEKYRHQIQILVKVKKTQIPNPNSKNQINKYQILADPINWNPCFAVFQGSSSKNAILAPTSNYNEQTF